MAFRGVSIGLSFLEYKEDAEVFTGVPYRTRSMFNGHGEE
jgi:hypothetical protein